MEIQLRFNSSGKVLVLRTTYEPRHDLCWHRRLSIIIIGGVEYIINTMGITTSTIDSSLRDENVTSSTAATNANDDACTSRSRSRYGLSADEVRHVLKLRRFVCHHAAQQQQPHHQSFVLLVWKYSLLLSSVAMSSSTSSSSNDDFFRSEHDGNRIVDMDMAFLEEQLSSEWKILVQKECVRIEKLLNSSSVLLKIDAGFTQLFNHRHNNNDNDSYNRDKLLDDQLFLEKIAAIILGDQYHLYNGGARQDQNFTMEFLLSISSTSDDGSIAAKDVIETCMDLASLYHRVLIQDALLDGNDGTNIESPINDDTMKQSMTNSVLEYVKNYRANQHFEYGEHATVSTFSPVSSATVNRREFIDWQRQVCPDLFQSSISRFLHFIIFPPQYIKSQRMQRLTPFPTILSSKEFTSRTTIQSNGDETCAEGRERIISLSSAVFGTNTRSSSSISSDGLRAPATTYLSPSLFVFTTISLSKFGECWYQIYDGENHGWTFQSMEHAILGYAGPTLFVIRANDKNGTVTLGAYTASNWEKNRRGQFFGNSDCFLFQLQPTLRVLKSLPKMGTRGGNYMYLHSTSNISNPSRKDDLALGIGFGGTARRPRLFIDGQLEECTVSAQDSSFEEGHLGLQSMSLSDPPSSSSSTTLHISSLEIYAVGDRDTIRNGFQAQYQHRDIADATLRNARTVDKAAFLGDMRSGIIESKAFAHRGQVDGRANGYMKGEERK